MAKYLDLREIGTWPEADFKRMDDVDCPGLTGDTSSFTITHLWVNSIQRDMIVLQDRSPNKGDSAINMAERVIARYEDHIGLNHGSAIHVLRQTKPFNHLYILRFMRTRERLQVSKGFITKSPYSRPFFFPITKAAFIDLIKTGDLDRYLKTKNKTV